MVQRVPIGTWLHAFWLKPDAKGMYSTRTPMRATSLHNGDLTRLVHPPTRTAARIHSIISDRTMMDLSRSKVIYPRSSTGTRSIDVCTAVTGADRDRYRRSGPLPCRSQGTAQGGKNKGIKVQPRLQRCTAVDSTRHISNMDLPSSHKTTTYTVCEH